MNKLITTIKSKALGISSLAVVAAAGLGSSASAMSFSYPGIQSSGYQNASAYQNGNNSGNSGQSGQQSSGSTVDASYHDSTTLYYNHNVDATYKASQYQNASFNNYNNFMNSLNKGANASEGFNFGQWGW